MKNSQPTKGKIPGRERTITLLGDELCFDIPIKIFKKTKELAHKHNYKLLYIAGEAYKTPFEYHIQSNILYNLINPQTTDGLIMISNLLCSYVSPREFHKYCRQFHPLPIVSLGLAMRNIPSVVLNNAAGMNDAVCHLIQDHHCTRIAFLSGPQDHTDVIERFTAFTRTMETHGLSVEKSLLLQGDFQHNSGIAAVRELIDIRGKKPGQDLQAIVCCNDYMASGVMLELQKRGIRIPEEIALVGFDDILFAECLAPSLSTVEQPFDTMATMAVELLIKLLEGKSVPDIMRVGARFIPRQSCGCPVAPCSANSPPLPKDMEILLRTAPHKFLEHLNKRIIISNKPTIMVWKEVLSRLNVKENWNWPSGTDDPARNFDQTELFLLGGTIYNNFNHTLYDNKIHDIGVALTSTLELSELLRILTDMLPGVGIKRCCICLYENPESTPGKLPPYSRLILAFNPKGSKKLPPEGLHFTTTRLLPEEIIKQQGWQSWVTIALYFHKEQIGYVLMDSEAHYENIYWNLHQQMSGALKGAKLLNETRKAYSLLKEANEQKTQFFINVAHETKTPLTLIQNFLALYLKEHTPDENLLVIKQNLDILLANMLNFLDVEKLQRGNTIYQHDNLVDLSESVRKKCALFQGVSKEKKIRIIMHVENNITIRIDPWALDRVLNNLLDNAVKYTQRGGLVSLDVRSRAGRAILRVSDNGPGLSADTSKHIFEPYYLLSRKKNGQQGMGVGLSIVKKIIDGLGAVITVDQPQRGGTSFTIVFRDSSEVPKQGKLQEIPGIVPSPLVQGNIKERNISEEKHSLLIVDDNIQLLKFMQTSLEKSYNVFLARDVPEAHFKLKTIPRPDIIISDIMMDGPDGFAFLTDLAAMDGYNDIPFIFLTAISGETKRIRALGLGAVDYIEKPFSITELMAKIDAIIALRSRQKQQEITYIRSRIDGVFTGMEPNTMSFAKPGFDALCIKYGITGREPDIIRLLLSGMIHKQIAIHLNISLRAVEYHITKIYKKCGVSNKFDFLNKFH